MPLFRFLFSFRGRTPRTGFWLFYLAHAFIYGVISIQLYQKARPYFGESHQADMAFTPLVPLFALFTALFFIPAAAVTTRRLHDRGRNGWWVLLGVGLAILACAVVVTYSYEFRIYLAGHDELPRRELMRLIMVVAVFAMIGYSPFSLVVMFYSLGTGNYENPSFANYGYNYILPAAFGVAPLALFGLWFLYEAGLRPGEPDANSYGAPPTSYFGASGTSPTGSWRRGSSQIAGAAVAIAGAAVLLSGMLEVRNKPCDLARTPGPSTLADNEFQDCFDVKGTRVCGPRMVRLPLGSFQMGSDRQPQETPVHAVTFARPFAIGKFELTHAQWEACVADGACRNIKYGHWKNLSRDPSGERCDSPIAVGWSLATLQYFPWLSAKTGKAYRLPSESEWEYAAHAGTDTGFPPGNIIRSDYANFDDSNEAERQVNPEPNKTYTFEDLKWKDTCWAYSTRKGKVLDVGSLKPNAYGLHDMLGNREEFVADVANARYAGVPADGSAAPCLPRGWCDHRILRGGHSCTRTSMLTPTARVFQPLAVQAAGFRAALTLSQSR
ncbi:MAG: SUMF1/EgtB/PvdO family nonheme iron enzyme [Hyphomicrobiaceae bacterium]